MQTSAEREKEKETLPSPPATADVSSGVRAKGPRRASLGGTRVLLVDDDLAFRLATATLIEAWGASVMAVESAEHALAELAKGERYDLVIVDYDLPRVRGDSLCRAIHYLSAQPPPVILVSGYDLRGVEGPFPGVVRSFQKPLVPGALFEAIASIVDEAKSGG